MKQDKFDEVVKVVRSTPPPFPGDPDPLYAVLDKLVQFLYRDCFNGGKVGEDGCPVCRAYRTEQADKRSEDLFKAYEQVTYERNEYAKESAERYKQVTQLTEQVKQLSYELENVQARVTKLATNYDKAREDYVSANTERGELAKHVTALQAELADVAGARDTYKERYMNIQAALKELV